MSGQAKIKKFNCRGYLVVQKPYNREVSVFTPEGRLLYTERPGYTYTQRRADRLVKEITGEEIFRRME